MSRRHITPAERDLIVALAEIAIDAHNNWGAAHPAAYAAFRPADWTRVRRLIVELADNTGELRSDEPDEDAETTYRPPGGRL
jgi:hypothetical protein